MAFSDLLYELSSAFGGGLERGIGEEIKLREQERGFRRLAPIRKAARAEEQEAKLGLEQEQAYRQAGLTYGPEYEAQVRAGQAPGEFQYKAGLEEAKAATGRRRTAAELGPMLRRLQVPGPQVPGAVSERLREAPAILPYEPPAELTEFGARELMDLLQKQTTTPREPIGGINPFASGYRAAKARGASEEQAIEAGSEAQATASGMGAKARLQVKTEAELAGLEDAMQTVETIDRYASRLITAKTPAKAAIQGAQLSAGAMTGWSPEAAAYQRSTGAWLETVGRQLGGARGVMTEGDISRLKDAMPGFWDLAETRRLKMGGIRNAMEAAISAKESVVKGETDLATARARVKKRIDELFKEGEAALGAGLPSGWRRR